MLVLSIPLVTIPAAYAAGIAHLERHLSGRDDSVRALWGTFRAALPGSWKLGITTAAAAVVIVLNLLLATVGQLPGQAVVLPATLILAAGRRDPAAAHRSCLVRLSPTPTLPSGPAASGPRRAALARRPCHRQGIVPARLDGLPAPGRRAVRRRRVRLDAGGAVRGGSRHPDPGRRLGQNALHPRLVQLVLSAAPTYNPRSPFHHYRVEPRRVFRPPPVRRVPPSHLRPPPRWYHPLAQHNYRLFVAIRSPGASASGCSGWPRTGWSSS